MILVHGIGEQRRFEHLDGQLRFLIRALHGLKAAPDEPVDEISVDISPSGAAAFHSEADTWNAGPEASVTVVVRHALGGVPKETRLRVHEVWWADVNEPYSLAKQFRFWLWGLAVWSRPDKQGTNLGSASLVSPPTIPKRNVLWDRARLFLTGVFFALLGYSIGMLTALANRLLNWRSPDILRVLSNYISSVKLYNQRRRYGAGLLWGREEFLDSVGEPPRVSIRRRMIRTIADVAYNDYQRWYVLAHSQGSVVAFNGLMESRYAWPGYLDEARWQRLRSKGLAGVAPVTAPDRNVMPRRPAWLEPTAIAYRPAIFRRFAGFFTYGSPIEKFAGIWPALVPVSTEPAFAENVPWLNIYDPIDPVSGQLLAYKNQSPACCPRAEDLGYAASWWLLLAHLKYLTRRRNGRDLATATVRWLLTDSTAHFPRDVTGWRVGSWFAPAAAHLGKASPQEWVRRIVAWGSWLAAACILLCLGAIFLPIVLEAVGAATSAVGKKILDFGPDWLRELTHGMAGRLGFLFGWGAALIAWIKEFGSSFWWRCVLLLGFAGALTGAVGMFARLFAFRRDDDDPKKHRRNQAAANRWLGI